MMLESDDANLAEVLRMTENSLDQVVDRLQAHEQQMQRLRQILATGESWDLDLARASVSITPVRSTGPGGILHNKVAAVGNMFRSMPEKLDKLRALGRSDGESSNQIPPLPQQPSGQSLQSMQPWNSLQSLQSPKRHVLAGTAGSQTNNSTGPAGISAAVAPLGLTSTAMTETSTHELPPPVPAPPAPHLPGVAFEHTLSTEVETVKPSTATATFSRAKSLNSEDSLRQNFSIKLYPDWSWEEGEEARLARFSKTLAGPSRSWGAADLGDFIASTMDSSMCTFGVLSPTSYFKLVWDFISIIFLCYEVLALPLAVFDYDDTEFARALRNITVTFWACDIVLTFFTGFLTPSGHAEMRPFYIAKRYIQSWFLLDIFIVGTDILMALSEAGEGGGGAIGVLRMGKTMRIARLSRCIRMLRMTRMLKLRGVLDKVGDAFIPGSVTTTMAILKLMSVYAAMVHFLACLWYAVGMECHDQGLVSWLEPMLATHDTKLAIYATSFHWVVAQFTPCPHNFHPQNAWERCFAILVVMAGMVLFSSLIGNTAALITQSRNVAYKRVLEIDQMRSFLAQSGVSLDIGNQVMHHIRSAQQTRARLLEGDVAALRTLPPSLLTELRYEVYSRALRYPFFTWLNTSHSKTMSLVCQQAVSQIAYGRDEEPFAHHTQYQGMFFVQSGKFRYFPGVNSFVGYGNDSCKLQHETKFVEAGEGLAEAGLWMEWEHRGLLKATCRCYVIHIDPMEFRLSILKRVSSVRRVKFYAQRFLDKVKAAMHDGDIIDDTFTAFACERDLKLAIAFADHRSNTKVLREG